MLTQTDVGANAVDAVGDLLQMYPTRRMFHRRPGGGQQGPPRILGFCERPRLQTTRVEEGNDTS